MGRWLVTAIASLSDLIKTQSGEQRAYTTELRELPRYCGGRANVEKRSNLQFEPVSYRITLAVEFTALLCRMRK